MKERLKKLRISLGYSIQEMSEKLDIPSNTYIGYEYRTKNLPLDFLIDLINIFNVNVNWLLTGEGDMFRNSFTNSSLEIQNDISVNKKIAAIGSRLSLIQEKNNLLDREMAKILGIYEDDYFDIKQGNRELNFKIINKLKQSFKLSIDWLLYGG